MRPELQQLREMSLPDPVGWMPQSIGWYVVFATAGVGLIWFAWRRYQYWRANRYRGDALRRLAEIESRLSEPGEGGSALREIPVVVKRTALAFASRDRIADLSGDRWLEFLDSTLGGRHFSTGPGRLLPVISYMPSSDLSTLGQGAISDLIGLVREWIRKHHA